MKAASLTPGERRAYEEGWKAGFNHCGEMTRKGRLGDTDNPLRAEAFGAIRRAARVARDQDDIVGVAQSSDAQSFHWYAALHIRQAIRAAIGSDKA